MRVYYNGWLKQDGRAGSDAHIRQFLTHSVALGHEVWTSRRDTHSGTHKIPPGGPACVAAVQAADVVYLRLEWSPLRANRWAVDPRRRILPNLVHVWEFNTVPEYGRLCGRCDTDVRRAVERFRAYGRGCDLAICVSERLSRYVRHELGLRRVVTVANASEPDRFRPGVPPSATMPAFEPDALHVVWLCTTYVGWHDFASLRTVAQLLWNDATGRRIIFHIIGEDDRWAAGARTAFMNGMPPNVRYHGAQDYEVLPSWLSAMHVGLCLYRPGPADYSSPLKLFDYMASGLAVVGTDHPQLRAVLAEIGASDTLAPHNDTRCLVDILLDLALHPEKARAMGAAGRKRVQEYYNWRRAIGDTYTAIATVVAERATPPRAAAAL